jgi:hypothetical protein
VIGGGDFNFENAEEKLKQLAIQLGEACLTNDLAALISQKRDLQMVKTARKGAVSSGAGGKRSASVNYYGGKKVEEEGMMRRVNMGSFVSQGESKEHNCLQIQARLLLLNLAYKLLKRYDVNESRFLKQPISSLNSYLSSKRFKQIIKQKMIQAFEEGTSDILGLSLRKYQGF